MLSWAPYPFLRITIVFVLGILAGEFKWIVWGLPLTARLLLLSLFLFAVTGGLIRKLNFLKYNPVIGVVGLLNVFLLGYLSLWLKKAENSEDHLLNINAPVQYYVGTIASQPEATKKSIKIIVQLEKVSTAAAGWGNATGKVLVYLEKGKGDVTALGYGDKLLVKGDPSVVNPPQNPAQFDYRLFLARKGIHHRHFIRQSDFKKVGHSKYFFPIFYAIKARQWAEKKFLNYVKGEGAQGIVLALVLGQKAYVTPDIKQAYTNTGAMHVLAVSGLHVGIIYGLISVVLAMVKRNRLLYFIAVACSVAALLAFAMLTGFSPSVLRAVFMSVLLIVAGVIRRRSYVYNTIAVSAICILAVDPYMVFDVGFQLSYLAVFGIVFLQPKIDGLFYFKNKFLSWVWQITSLSLAAQIATFAVTLYYFHQFPVYFLVSNLFVIIAAFIILYGGIALILFSFVKPLAILIGLFLSYFVDGINALLVFISHWPYSVMGGVYFNGWQLATLMALVMSVILLFQFRRFQFLIFGVLCAGVFSAIELYTFSKVQDKNRIVFYGIAKTSAMDIIIDHGAQLVVDEKSQGDILGLPYSVDGNRAMLGLPLLDSVGIRTYKESAYFRQCEYGFYGVFGGKRILILDKPMYVGSSKRVVKVDYLVVQNDVVNSIENLLGHFEIGTLVLDNNNSHFKVRRLVAEADKMGQAYHSIPHHGALEIVFD